MFKNANRRASRLIRGLAVFGALLFGSTGLRAGDAAPRVVVSLKPLHSIVAGVMQGVGDPVLLVSGAESPHGFALRPSQARALQEADAVFWVGPELERFLVKPLKSLRKKSKSVAVSETIPLLPFRQQGVWRRTEDHTKTQHTHGHDHGTRDPHFWLDPVRVRGLVPHVERTLSLVDPENAERYRSNAKRLEHRLAQLHGRLDATLAPVRQIPYLVFHDAYQYLETRYRLASVGAVTLDPDRRPGARHLSMIRHKVSEENVKCMFREPQLSASAISVVRETFDVRLGELDPLGVAETPGPDAYFNTLHNLAENLVNCLKDNAPQRQ